MQCKTAPLQLSQDLGYYHNLLRQVLLYKAKKLYMGGKSEPSAHKQGKNKSIRAWLDRLHQTVISQFPKQGSSGARLEHAGLAPTHMPSFLPTETRHERGTGSHLRLKSGHDPGRHLDLGSGQKLCSTA